MNGMIEALGIALIVIAPFGEGGRAPGSLFVLHTMALGIMTLAVLRPNGRASFSMGLWERSTVAGLAAGLGLSGAAALRASYPLAAGLGLWDLLIPVGLFVVFMSAPFAAPAVGRLRTSVAMSSLLQAAIALVRWTRADGLGAGALAAGASFLNPDHLGAFLNLGFVLWLTPALLACERRDARRAILGLAAASLHGLAILVLMSRGALVGLAGALLLLFALRWRSSGAPGRWIAAGAFVLVVLVGSGMIVVRFARSDDPYRYHRLQIWQASAGMLAERPFLGYGPGMFRYEGPRHNFPVEVGPFRYEKIFSGGHSAPLTLAVEVGLPAALCFAVVTLLVVGRLLRAGEGGATGATGLAIGIGLAALVVQGLFEDLQERPALLILPAILAGAVLGQRRRAAAGAVAEPAAHAGTAVVPDTVRPLHPAPAAVALTGAVYLFAIAVLLPYWADREARIGLRLGRAGLPKMERAMSLNPWHPDYPESVAMAVLNSGSMTPDRYARSAVLLLEARRLDPSDARFPLLLGRLEGRVAAGLFSDPSARQRATIYYEAAARLSPCDPRPLLELGGWELEGDDVPLALDAARQALRMEPNFVRARLLEATCLLRLGRHDEARDAYRGAQEALRVTKGRAGDSGYAADLAADAPSERARLEAALGSIE